MSTANLVRAVRGLSGVLLVCAICGAQAQEPQPPVAPEPAPENSSPAPVEASSTPVVADEQAAPADAPPATVEETIPVEPVQQMAEENLAAPTEVEGAQRLDDIVVTATKRAAPVRSIPATINVLSGEDLEREGVQSIDQIVTMVPGVNLTDDGTGGSAKRITIRGVSTGFGVNPTSGTLFGDIPFSDPFAPKVQLDPNPFDMATVEVLKGPQGTLFGGTGLNGLIRYVPESPSLDAFQVKYYGQYMAYPGNGGNAWNYGAMVNAPFADHSAAVRIMAFKREAPGYVDDTSKNPAREDVNTLDQYGVRAMLTWLPAEHWTVSLMGTTQKTDEADIVYTDNYDGDLSHDDSPRPSPAEYSYTLGDLGIEREFEWGSVISKTSYFEKKFNIFLEASRAIGGLLPVLAGADDNHSEGLIQELRLVSAPGDSPWKWLGGAFYYKTDLYDCASVGALGGLPSLPFPDPLGGLLANACPGNAALVGDELIIGQLTGDITVKELALFGELTRELGEHWEVTLGGRGYRSESAGTVYTEGAIYGTQNNLQPGVYPRSLEERGFSPKASIVFHPTDDLRSYFTVTRGFRFGGPQLAADTATAEIPEVYKSDSLWNYELGLRTDWLDRTLRFDASVYYIDWTNPQVFQRQEIVAGIGLSNYIDNVGSAKGRGAEMSLRYLFPFLPGLSLDAGVALNKTVTTAPFQSATGVEVPSGSRWPLASRVQSATTLAYTLPLEDWQAGASLRHAYLGKACNTIECTAEVFGYRTLDFNLFAGAMSGSWLPQLSLSVNNLTDERGIGNITTNPDPAGDSVTYIAPRAIVVRLSGSF